MPKDPKDVESLKNEASFAEREGVLQKREAEIALKEKALLDAAAAARQKNAPRLCRKTGRRRAHRGARPGPDCGALDGLVR